MTKIVIAFYDKAEQAKQISQELSRLDIAQNEMSVVDGKGGSGAQGLLQGSGPSQNLFEQLGRFGVSQEEAKLYVKGLEHGGGLVIARVEDQKAEQAGEAMERLPVVDIEARAQQWRNEDEQGEQSRHQESQTVRAVEEQLQVGKRETQAGRVRIHTHVEEVPVEERIRLREEEISVDRHRVDRTLSPDEVEGAFREQTLEVTATREQPVVSKQARVVEEVSVGKSQHEREEVVRDKVRRTRLDVEQEGVKQDS